MRDSAWFASPLRCAAMAVLCFSIGACPSRERPPPEVAGVDLGRLTTEELGLYRRVLAEEVSPCGGGASLEVALRSGRCPLAPWAARFVAHRVEENDSREEIAERYLERYGATRRQEVPTDGAPSTGDPDAPVVLVVFSDFTCTHCSRAATLLRELVEARQGRVRLVYRNYPLLQQRASGLAAVAGLAAHRQDRFWELHDSMFERQRTLSAELIQDLAEEAGLDMDRFRDDLLYPGVEAQVRADRALGERLGVRGTPTLYVNGRLFDEPMARIDSAIDEELARVEMNRGEPSPSKAPGAGDADAP